MIPIYHIYLKFLSACSPVGVLARCVLQAAGAPHCRWLLLPAELRSVGLSRPRLRHSALGCPASSSAPATARPHTAAPGARALSPPGHQHISAAHIIIASSLTVHLILPAVRSRHNCGVYEQLCIITVGLPATRNISTGQRSHPSDTAAATALLSIPGQSSNLIGDKDKEGAFINGYNIFAF